MTTNAYSPLWFQLFMPLQTEEQTRKDVAFLTRQLPLPRYRRVLDLCCGYGRHAIPLAAHGYEVIGLDRDAGAIAEAQRHAALAGQEIAFVAADMRQVGELDELDGPFDAVINMWQSFSYFDEPTNRHVLRQLHALLNDGGRFIIDLYHRGYFERHAGHARRELNGITIETESYMAEDRWHSILRYRDATGDIGSDHMDWRLYMPDEFAEHAAECGFQSMLACAWCDERTTPSAEIARAQLVLRKI